MRLSFMNMENGSTAGGSSPFKRRLNDLFSGKGTFDDILMSASPDAHRRSPLRQAAVPIDHQIIIPAAPKEDDAVELRSSGFAIEPVPAVVAEEVVNNKKKRKRKQRNAGHHQQLT